uniref:hypothetical protein n=1 Tax=Paraburkholderia mimosarum TaxID=312026 RepID=UPI001ABA9496
FTPVGLNATALPHSISVKVSAPRMISLGASGGPSINASRTLRDDVFQRYFSNLLNQSCRLQ